MAVPDPLQLTPAQAFDLERMSRAIDATTDVLTLQAIAKQLLQAWLTQRAATSWVMRQGLAGRSQGLAGASPVAPQPPIP